MIGSTLGFSDGTEMHSYDVLVPVMANLWVDLLDKMMDVSWDLHMVLFMAFL